MCLRVRITSSAAWAARAMGSAARSCALLSCHSIQGSRAVRPVRPWPVRTASCSAADRMFRCSQCSPGKPKAARAAALLCAQDPQERGRQKQQKRGGHGEIRRHTRVRRDHARALGSDSGAFSIGDCSGNSFSAIFSLGVSLHQRDFATFRAIP